MTWTIVIVVLLAIRGTDILYKGMKSRDERLGPAKDLISDSWGRSFWSKVVVVVVFICLSPVVGGMAVIGDLAKIFQKP